MMIVATILYTIGDYGVHLFVTTTAHRMRIPHHVVSPVLMVLYAYLLSNVVAIYGFPHYYGLFDGHAAHTIALIWSGQAYAGCLLVHMSSSPLST